MLIDIPTAIHNKIKVPKAARTMAEGMYPSIKSIKLLVKGTPGTR